MLHMTDTSTDLMCQVCFKQDDLALRVRLNGQLLTTHTTSLSYVVVYNHDLNESSAPREKCADTRITFHGRNHSIHTVEFVMIEIVGNRPFQTVLSSVSIELEPPSITDTSEPPSNTTVTGLAAKHNQTNTNKDEPVNVAVTVAGWVIALALSLVCALLVLLWYKTKSKKRRQVVPEDVRMVSRFKQAKLSLKLHAH